MSLQTRNAVAFALGAVILLLPADCGPYVDAIHRLELSGCPDEAFSLPDSSSAGAFRLATFEHRRRAESYRVCPGFKVYQLREDGEDRLYYYVRLNRRQTCTLDVGYGYLGTLFEGPSEAVEKRRTPWVETVAELVMQSSDVAPRIPAASVARLDSDERRAEWCEISAGAEEE